MSLKRSIEALIRCVVPMECTKIEKIGIIIIAIVNNWHYLLVGKANQAEKSHERIESGFCVSIE